MATRGRMTGCERVKRMMEREDHDRIPRRDSYWDETIARWQGEGLNGGHDTVSDLLESDFEGICWSWPSPYPGRLEVQSQDEQTQVAVDQFGQILRTWRHRSGTPEHLGWECTDSGVWHDRIKPAMEGTGLHVDVEEVKKRYAAGRKRGRWCHLATVEAFEASRKLMGDETALMAMASEPEWIVDVSRTHTDMVLRDLEAILDAGMEPDGLWIYGDMAYNHATVCSPTTYRELIWPDHKRMADWAHERGMHVIFHTDGDVSAVLDLYIEAGFDCLQPLEAKANMDVRVLADDYADRLAFFGNINAMLMADGGRDALEEEMRTKLGACMEHRAYAYHSDHSVPPSVSWATYRFVMEMIEKYGNYC